ncbi:hypothetical protein [Bradyrhizobium sp.]|uniref:hypothetical protein n=1 Tax=Bradyrhizobium sp. TaxID=376 RepID=UPI001EB95048|nr:hypothetical protein [Bradyrhizobium sp.]MBV8922223.1 hypothetical protein [Bradyrhizobium sp.]MBV9981565.1 hypothetical protein [Bradyrhizobium sp.]
MREAEILRLPVRMVRLAWLTLSSRSLRAENHHCLRDGLEQRDEGRRDERELDGRRAAFRAYQAPAAKKLRVVGSS